MKPKLYMSKLPTLTPVREPVGTSPQSIRTLSRVRNSHKSRVLRPECSRLLRCCPSHPQPIQRGETGNGELRRWSLAYGTCRRQCLALMIVSILRTTRDLRPAKSTSGQAIVSRRIVKAMRVVYMSISLVPLPSRMCKCM